MDCNIATLWVHACSIYHTNELLISQVILADCELGCDGVFGRVISRCHSVIVRFCFCPVIC